MSLVSDALKKAQRLRAEQSARTGREADLFTAVRPGRRRRREVSVWWIVAAAGVVLLLALSWIYVRRERPAAESTLTVAQPPVDAAGPEITSEPVADSGNAESASAATESPFIAPGVSPAASATEPAYDIAGVTVMGKTTLLSITRRSDGRSLWISVGKTVGEVTLVSYDADTEQAVIQVDGRSITITMRVAPPSPNGGEG